MSHFQKHHNMTLNYVVQHVRQGPRLIGSTFGHYEGVMDNQSLYKKTELCPVLTRPLLNACILSSLRSSPSPEVLKCHEFQSM